MGIWTWIECSTNSAKPQRPNGADRGPAAIRIRGGTPTVTVTRPDGTVVPDPPSPWPARTRLAESNPDVAELLEIMGQNTQPLNWIDLRKVYEIIEHPIGERTLVRRGWATRRQIKAFGSSANRPDVSGKDARHARVSGNPPKD